MLPWLQRLLLCLLIVPRSLFALFPLPRPTSLRPALPQRRSTKHGARSLSFRSSPLLRHEKMTMSSCASRSPVFTPRFLLLRSLLFTLLLLLLVLPIPSVSAASDDVYLVPNFPVKDTTLFPNTNVRIGWDAYHETKYLSKAQPITIELVRKRRTPRSERQLTLRKIPFYNQNVTVVHTIANLNQRDGFYSWRVPQYWADDAPKFGGAYYIRIRPSNLTGRTPEEVAYLNNLPLHHHLFLNTKDDSKLGPMSESDRDDGSRPDTGGDPDPLDASDDLDYRPGGDTIPSQLETDPNASRQEVKKESAPAIGPLERYKVQILGCVIGIVVFAVIIVTIICLGPRRRAHRRRKAAIEAVSKVTEGKFSHLNKDFGAVIEPRHLPAAPHAYHASSQPPPPLLPPPPLPPSSLYPTAALPPQTSASSTASSASSGSNASHTSTTDFLISSNENGEHYAPYHADVSSSTNGITFPSTVPSAQPIRGILKNTNKTFAPPVIPTLERRASRLDTGPVDHLWRGRMPLEGIVEQDEDTILEEEEE